MRLQKLEQERVPARAKKSLPSNGNPQLALEKAMLSNERHGRGEWGKGHLGNG